MPSLLRSLPLAARLGTARYKICVAIAAATPAAMFDRAAQALAGQNLLLELRLDSLAHPAEALPALRMLLAANPDAAVIATCRRTQAGGSFSGTLAEELAVLTAAAEAGCAVVDLSIESVEEAAGSLEPFRTAVARAGAALLISHHDFGETRPLAPTFARLAAHRPEIVKIVATANGLADNLAVLRLLREQHTLPIVGIAMGEAGLLSRVLGVPAGGLFTFASFEEGGETAPGQLAAATLRELYRLDPTEPHAPKSSAAHTPEPLATSSGSGRAELGPATRVYAVAGKPITHSLSPLMHNRGFQALRLDSVYLPLATSWVDDLMQVARALPLHGLSITMPLKQAILPHLDWIDPLAVRVGACNTVVRTASGAFHGYNTDVAGVVAPLEKRLSLRGARVLVLGAGGAARAAVFGLCDKGAEVWILNRTAAAAASLAEETGARVADRSMLTRPGFDVLINATPAGMLGHSGPAEDQDPLCADLIFDMVYNPLETVLLKRARAQGLPVIEGVEMFVQQGAQQFTLWTGAAAPEQAMQAVVVGALQEREAASIRDRNVEPR